MMAFLDMQCRVWLLRRVTIAREKNQWLSKNIRYDNGIRVIDKLFAWLL
jgi:hypothetical protein